VRGRATTDLAHAVRKHVLRMTSAGKSSHVGSCLSVADILAVLYGAVATHDPTDPLAPHRDRVILSKGHAGAAIYAVLAEVGYFATDWLADHCANGSVLSGHVTHVGVPGVELSTGSLGHGLSVGAGMALRAVRRGLGYRVFVVLSDGECDEGSVWEAAMFAGHHRLKPLTAVVDYNKMQSLASTAATLELEPFADKWRAFGWEAEEVDGHDHDALSLALSARAPDAGRPRCVIAHTVKGKGVPFMEGSVLWHYRHPSADELDAALLALADDQP
jgi:transketolase